MSQQASLPKTPFFAQDDYLCGPAVLATLFAASGQRPSLADLTEQVYLPARKGSLQPEMFAATRRAGLLPYPLRPELHSLFEAVDQGYPVAVLQNVRLAVWPQWHYAVLIGYDLAAQTVTLHTGTFAHQTQRLAEFARTWELGGRWAFIALDRNRVPKLAEEGIYLTQLPTLEQIDAITAGDFYRAALMRWPTSLPARIGLGNQLYKSGDLPSAEQNYRLAIADHPDSPDAWNNLAQVLLEEGHPRMAYGAVRKAIDAGGPRVSIYHRTARSIANKLIGPAEMIGSDR